jgi:hypothetical protein
VDGEGERVAYRSEAESRDEAAVEEAEGEEGHGGDGVDDGEDVVELEGPVAGAVVGLVHVPERGVPQRPVRPPRPELHPDLREPSRRRRLLTGKCKSILLARVPRVLTAAPTDSAKVPNISVTGISPP